MEISYLLSKTYKSTNHHAFFNVKCCVMIDLLFNILAYSILILSACWHFINIAQELESVHN